MRYRDDMMNKMPSAAGPQQMPADYGTPNYGGYPMQPYMNSGSIMGAKMLNGSYMKEQDSAAMGAQKPAKTLPAAGANTMPAAGNGKAAALPAVSPAKGSGTMPAALPVITTGMMPATLPATTAITTASPAVTSASGCGAHAYPAVSVQNGAAAVPVSQGWTQMPTTVESTLFTPGFLRTQIGRRVRVEFLIGTNNLTDRTGTLVEVGASYILIQPIDSDDLMMCDIYSIKFVTIIL